MDRYRVVSGNNGIVLVYDKNNSYYEIHAGEKIWKQDACFNPYLEFFFWDKPVKLFLKDAKSINAEEFTTGVGKGISIRYSNWDYHGDVIPLEIETMAWIDSVYNDLHMELAPINEENLRIDKVVWPAPFEFKEPSAKAYSVIPMMQGCIIPNNWPVRVDPLKPTQYYERAAYMPWWGQIENGYGYIAIAETPWDGGYELEHPEGGPTRLNPVWHSSLGKIGYTRKIKYSFLTDCDYNSLCKVYRSYVKQNGSFVTLEEKAIRNRNVNRLVGSPVIHTNIYTHRKPESLIYDRANPESNEVLHTFMERAQQLISLKKRGVEKAYVHLDGWGKKGYDNMHPDIIPPCKDAGGWAEMKKLSDSCKEIGYIFATHDQYRDYYTDAESFNENQAIYDINGKVPYECTWDGGEQAYLCTQLAPLYIRRNFEALKENGVELTGTYLDVFSVVYLDECFHSKHKMTRKECMEKRTECFEYVRSEGILASSEETVDWAVPHMELCHHAPYPLYPDIGEGKAKGIPVPLFNLVYHECIVIPWALTKGGWGIPENDSGFLYALLNGGTGYLGIEAGDEEIRKNKIVCDTHSELAKLEMVRHDFLSEDYRKQRAVYSDGTIVEIDLETDDYQIHKSEKPCN